MTVLVTGAAGFIGYHVCLNLLKQGTSVIGFDNLNPYYDPDLKRARIAQLQTISREINTPLSLLKVICKSVMTLKPLLPCTNLQKL